MNSLPARVRHGYGFGALSLAVANTAVMFFLLKYLIDGVGLSPGTAGTVLLLGKAWDAVSDPIVGRLSDQTDTRWGARRPWLVLGAVPFAVLFAMLWWGLPLTGGAAVVGYGVLLLAYSTAYTAVVVPYGALTPALTEDYDERTRLNGARMGWSMLGGLVAGIAFPMALEATGSWRTAGLILVPLVALPPLVTAWVTAGFDEPRDAVESPSMWSVLSSGPFRRVALLFASAWSCIAVLSALIPFYVEHHVGRMDLLDATFAAIQLSALMFIPLVVWTARRVEKHHAYAVAMCTWAVVLLALAAAPAGRPDLVIILALASGVGVAAAHVLPWAMLPDVLEADRVETGLDRSGAFYGMMTFVEKASTAVALWTVGMVLEVAGYAQGASVQPEAAIDAVRFMLGPVPAAVLGLAAIAAVLRPPVTRAAHKALVARLHAA